MNDDSNIPRNAVISSADMTDRLCASQPVTAGIGLSRMPSTGHSTENPPDVFGGFTQPARLSDLMGSGSQTGSQARATQSSRFQRLVKRMTRFWVTGAFDETDKFLHGLFEKMQYSFKCKPKGIVSFSFSNHKNYDGGAFKANFENRI